MIKHYEVYIKVVELGSFSKAAKELYLSQPTVTASIKTLERDLGVSLIDRSIRKLTLTEAGETTYNYAKKIIENNSKLKEVLVEESNSMTGSITLPSSTFGKAYFLEKAIPSFLKKYPEISLKIDIRSSLEIVNGIKSNEINFGIVGDNSDKSFNYSLIAVHDLVLIAPKGKFKDRSSITIEELKQLPLIKRGVKSSTYKSFVDALRARNINPSDLNYVLEVDDLEFIKRMVLSNVGCSIVNDSSIRKAEKKVFDLLRIEGISAKREFFVASTKKHHLSYAERKLIEYLTSFANKKVSK